MFQIEMRDLRDNPIGRGRWFPVASAEGFPERTPAEWAEELRAITMTDTRNVEFRLVWNKDR